MDYTENLRPIKNYVLVEMSKEFEDTHKINEDLELVIDVSWANYQHVRQNATVVCLSENVKNVCIGDEVWIHHFVPTDEDMTGKPVSLHDKYLFKKTGKKMYWVDATPREKKGPEQLLAYRGKDGVLKTYGNFVLVEPIKQEIPQTASGIFLMSTPPKEVREEGIVVCSNDTLRAYGVNEGDRVKFSKNSEYELKVDDKVYWKMHTTDIILKYDEKGT